MAVTPYTIDDSGALAAHRRQLSANKRLRRSWKKVEKGARDALTVAEQMLQKNAGQAVRTSRRIETMANSLDKAGKSSARFSAGQKQASSGVQGFGVALGGAAAAITSVLILLKVIGAAFKALFSLVRNGVTAFADLQDAVVSLRKVTDELGEKGLSSLVTRLEDMSTGAIPIATERLIELAAVAGQLGIESEAGLATAAATGAKLEAATDLAAEAAIKGLSRILAIQGEAVTSIDRLGSSLVELGNTSRATESEIAPVANEIARATGNFDIASPTILGFSAALAEMGAKAEGSGSAISELFGAILRARETGEGIQELADIAGVSADELRRLASNDIGGAAVTFLTGLGTFGERGALALESVGLSSKRTAKALLPLAANADRLADRIQVANVAFKENTALDKEAAAAFSTLRSDLQRAQNSFRLLLAEGVKPLAKPMSKMLGDLVDLTKAWRAFGKGLKEIPGFAKAASVALNILSNRLETDLALLKALPLAITAIPVDIFGRIVTQLRDVASIAPLGAGAPLLVLADSIEEVQLEFIKMTAGLGKNEDALGKNEDAQEDLGDEIIRSGGASGDFTGELDKASTALGKLQAEATRTQSVAIAMETFGVSAADAGQIVTTLTEIQIESGLQGQAAALAVQNLLGQTDNASLNAVVDLTKQITRQKDELQEIAALQERIAAAREALAAPGFTPGRGPGGVTIPGSFESPLEGIGEFSGLEDLDAATESYASTLGELSEGTDVLRELFGELGGELGEIGGKILDVFEAFGGLGGLGGGGGIRGSGAITGAGTSVQSLGSAGQAASALGVVGALVALYNVGLQAVAKAELKRFSGQIALTTRDGQRINERGFATSSTEVDQSRNVEARKVFNQLSTSLDSIFLAMGGFAQQLPEIALKIRNDGKAVEVTLGGVLLGIFDTVEDAISQGIRAALAQGTFSGIGDTVAAVLSRATADVGIDQLAKDLDFARLIDTAGMSEVGKAVENIGIQFSQMRDRLQEFLTVGEGFGPAFENLIILRNEELDAIKSTIEDGFGQFIPGFGRGIETLIEMTKESDAFAGALDKEKEARERELVAIQKAATAAEHKAQVESLPPLIPALGGGGGGGLVGSGGFVGGVGLDPGGPGLSGGGGGIIQQGRQLEGALATLGGAILSVAGNSEEGSVILRGAGSEAQEGLAELTDGLMTLGPSLRETRDEAGNIIDGMGNTILAGMEDLTDAGSDVEQEMRGIEEALEDIPGAIDPELIRQAVEGAASGVGTTLANLTRQVLGDQVLNAELQRFAALDAQLAIIQQIKSAQDLLAVEGLLTGATRVLLLGVVEEAKKALDILLAGGGLAAPGRGAGSGRRKEAQQEAERAADASAAAAESFRDRVSSLHDALSDATPSMLAYRKSVAEMTEQATLGKIGSEELAEGLSLLAEVDLRAIGEEFSVTARDLRRSDLGSEIKALGDRFSAAQAEAQARRGENPEAFLEAMKNLRKGLDVELKALGKQTLKGLSGPLRGLKADGKAAVKEIESLVKNMAKLGLTAKQISKTVRSGIVPDLKAMQLAEAERVGDLDLVRKLQEQQVQREKDIALINLAVAESMLIAANALGEGIANTIASIREMLELPDAIVAATDDALGSVGGGGFAGGGGVSVSTGAGDVTALADAINAFVRGLNELDIGEFERQAQDFVNTEADFDRDVARVFADLAANDLSLLGTAAAIGGISGGLEGLMNASADEIQGVIDAVSGLPGFAELIDELELLQAAAGLEGTEGLLIQSLLDQFAEPLEETGGLLDPIVAQFTDLVAGLVILGASEEDLLASQATFVERQARAIEEFENSLKAGIRDRISELTRADPTRTNQEVFDEAQQNFEALAAIALDETASEAERIAAVQQLAAASEEFEDQIAAFLGAGPTAQPLLASMLELLEQVNAADIIVPIDPTQLDLLQSQEDLLSLQPTAIQQAASFDTLTEAILEASDRNFLNIAGFDIGQGIVQGLGNVTLTTPPEQAQATTTAQEDILAELRRMREELAAIRAQQAQQFNVEVENEFFAAQQRNEGNLNTAQAAEAADRNAMASEEKQDKGG